MAGQGVGFSELSTSSNGSDNTKRPGTPQITPSELSRPVNSQRIAQRKAQIKTYPVRKKLEKLGVYSSCKAEECCKCNGWKNPNPPPTPSRVDLSQPLANLTDPCRSCSHTLGAHISHLHDIPEDELNRLLCMVIDVENLFMCVHKEEDADTKQVYFYLFRLLRKGILQMATVTVEGPLGTPPFEKPSIGKAVLNFVLYKFGHLPQREWQMMHDLAKMFLHCHSQGEDLAAYKHNYTRSIMWSIILLLFSLQCCWAAECSRQNGPEWGNDCREGRPGEYEWWTCLNTTYIKQQTGNKVFCQYTRAKYCWTTCSIIKEYFKHPILMPVPEDCSCDPDAIPTRSPSLPSDCYSPSGHSCDWYRNCLEKSHPCEATTNAYALKYAENFCRLYDDQKSTFSQLGQQWIDAVRKCLQVALVQLLYPWSKSSCSDIRDRAFDSHIPCYLNPGKDTPSVCDLDCAEYFKIFFTIKGSFTELSTAWKSMEGMWHIGTKCAARKCLKAGFRRVIKGGRIVKEEFIRVWQIFVKIFKSKRKRRSSDFPLEGDAKYQFADRVGSAIAKAMNWDTEIVDWLAYPETLLGTDNPGVEDTQEITIVLADKKAINMTKTPKPSVDFNGAFNALASVIETGKLPLHVNDYEVWVKSLASCSDKSCNETQTVVISDKLPKWIAHAGTTSIGNFSFLECFSIWFILGHNLIF